MSEAPAARRVDSLAEIDDIEAIRAGITRAAQRGRSGGKALTSYNNRRQVEGFDQMLRDRQLSLDDLARIVPKGPSGLPLMPVICIISYRLSLFDVKPNTAKTYIAQLRAGLRVNWDMSAIDADRGRNGLLSRLQQAHERSYVEHGLRIDPRPMRPWRADDLRALLAAVDGRHRQGRTDLWRTSTRAILLLMWFSGARINEMILMTHNWLSTYDNEVVITFPAGLKHQRNDEQIYVGRTRDPALCPVTALAEWLEVARRAGMPQDTRDRVFVEVARHHGPSMPHKGGHHAIHRTWGGKPWVDRIQDQLQDPEWRPDLDDDERVAHACSNAIGIHRNSIKELLRDAGIETRGHERSGPHGARSGLATELHEAGEADTYIANLLRHREIATLGPYVHSRYTTRESLSNVIPIDEQHVQPRLAIEETARLLRDSSAA